MNGLRATKTAQAVMIAPPVPAHSPSLRCARHAGQCQGQAGPADQGKQRQDAVELGQDRQARGASGRDQEQQAQARWARESQDFQALQSQGQRDQQERLATGLGHGTVGVQTVEGIDRQQERRDRARSLVTKDRANGKDRHAADCPQNDRGQPRDEQLALGPPSIGCVVVPGERRSMAKGGESRLRGMRD